MQKKWVLSKRLIFIVVAIIAVYKLIAYAYFLILSAHYRQYLPPFVEIESNVYAGDSIGGFVEGCGVGIFKLSANTSAEISSKGVSFLNQNSKSNSGNDAHAEFSDWRETPHTASIYEQVTAPERWYAESSCAEVPVSLGTAINRSLRQKGSFYAATSTSEVLIIPSLKVAIFSHNK